MATLAHSWDTGHGVRSVVVSPDGARVGAGGWGVQLRDLHSGEMVLNTLQGHFCTISSGAYSRSGREFASGSDDETIRVWDTATGEVVNSRGVHSGVVTSVKFSYDDRLIVSGSWDRTVRLWDTRTGRSTSDLVIYVCSPVHSVALSPDGRKIVCGSDYGSTLNTYDAATYAILWGSTNYRGGVNSVKFSPDGRRIVSGSDDYTVRIWDASTGSSIGDPLEGHTHSVLSVALSPDSKYIASGSMDNTIRIWHAATGMQIDSLHDHTDLVTSVTFTPDGKTLVSGSMDKTIKLWDVLGMTCEIVETVRSCS